MEDKIAIFLGTALCVCIVVGIVGLVMLVRVHHHCF